MAGIFIGCQCAMSWPDIGVTFDLGSARMSFTATFETYFSYHKAPIIKQPIHLRILAAILNFDGNGKCHLSGNCRHRAISGILDALGC